MLTLPSGDDVEVEGSSEARPIKLEGIAKKDFRAFLRVLYPLYVAVLSVPSSGL